MRLLTGQMDKSRRWTAAEKKSEKWRNRDILVVTWVRNASELSSTVPRSFYFAIADVEKTPWFKVNSSEPKTKKINRKCKNVKIPFFVVFNYSLRREKIKEMHRLIDLRRISTVNRGFPAKRFFFAISNWDLTSLFFSHYNLFDKVDWLRSNKF